MSASDEEYRDERARLIDQEFDYAKSYDKYVLTLSGGALAISVTFVHDIIGEGPVCAPGLLFAAWSSFAISVALGLVAVNRSAPLYARFRDILDKHARGSGDRLPSDKIRTEQAADKGCKSMDWYNWGSLVLFLLGVILLLSFAGCNLIGGSGMPHEKQGQPNNQRIIEGGRPALAPVDTRPSDASAIPDGRGGKPALAPVDVTPPSPQPTPSESPPPSPPSNE